MRTYSWILGVTTLLGACGLSAEELSGEDGVDGKEDGLSSQCRLNDSIREASRTLLFDAGLASPSDDAEIIEGIYTRWTAVKAVRGNHPSRPCLIIMNLQTQIEQAGEDPIVELGDRWEVIAYSPATRRVSLFETAIALPRAVQFGFSGLNDDDGALPTDLYYAELTGDRSLDAYKAALAGIAYSGLAADISAKNIRMQDNTVIGDPDGKLAFDPTPNRTWKLTNVTYDLSRGSTAEIHDVRPSHLDGDFQAYFSGSDGHVAPWGFGAVRRWRLPDAVAWTELRITIER